MSGAAPSFIRMLRRERALYGDTVRERLRSFADVPPADYFYELVYCLLTPQSSARNAARAVEALRRADLEGRGTDPAPILARGEHYIRFHRTKAGRILQARSCYGEILHTLLTTPDSRELRLWLVRNVRGLGWKEASHFLRNIGRRDLAILDRHILRNLKLHGVVRTLPRTLTHARYLAIERSYLRFARRTGIPLDELDLLFWRRETGTILK
ncbi:MAG: DNA lyase [Bacteroidota bacterium]